MQDIAICCCRGHLLKQIRRDGGIKEAKGEELGFTRKHHVNKNPTWVCSFGESWFDEASYISRVWRVLFRAQAGPPCPRCTSNWCLLRHHARCVYGKRGPSGKIWKETKSAEFQEWDHVSSHKDWSWMNCRACRGVPGCMWLPHAGNPEENELLPFKSNAIPSRCAWWISQFLACIVMVT